MRRKRGNLLWIVSGLIGIGAAVLYQQAPSIAAGALLYPVRMPFKPKPANCQAVTFAGEGVELAGWRCRPASSARGTIVFLHGVADNRTSGNGVIARYTAQGYDVIAYDSRAHGDSQGTMCTYGFFERHDLLRVLATVEHQPIALIGHSLGAAVALQAAGEGANVATIVAAETFSDLQTIATERAPRILSDNLIARALRFAEERAGFRVDAVSPVHAAARIRVPVLLIHGAQDFDTPPAHSERVLAALAGPKRLIRVAGAVHAQSLRDEAVWAEIDAWIQNALATRQPAAE